MCLCVRVCAIGQNDVWIRVPVDLRLDSGWPSGASPRVWRRLPEAPFSPRSNMLFLAGDPALNPVDRKSYLLLVQGGQTGHMCGLRELGVCSDESWLATVTRTDDGEFTISWERGQDLGFRPRCGALLAYTAGYPVAVIAGQWSYNDSSCQSAPAVTNEVWYASGPFNSSYWRGADAPFAARRSMQLGHAFGWFEATTRRRGGGASAVTGGMRVLSQRAAVSDGQTQSRLTRVLMYADAWICRQPNTTSQCVWGWTQAAGQDPIMTGSTPLPSVDGLLAAAGGQPVSPFIMGDAQQYGTRVGGRSSLAAVRQWRNVPPVMYAEPGDAADSSQILANVSLMVQPEPGPLDNPTAEAVNESRLGVPVAFALEEDELNDANGSWAAGSDWVTSFGPIATRLHLAFHQQRLAMADEPAASSWYLPQPFSSANTSRPRLNFALPRLEASIAFHPFFYGSKHPETQSECHIGTAVQVMAGGRSGSDYNSDWLVLHPTVCFPPNDPSFGAALGPVILVGGSSTRAVAVGDSVVVECPDGFHFEPP